MIVFTVNEHEYICIVGVNLRAGYATVRHTCRRSTFLWLKVRGCRKALVWGVNTSLRAKFPMTFWTTTVELGAGTSDGREFVLGRGSSSLLDGSTMIGVSNFGNISCLDMWELRGCSRGNSTLICLSLNEKKIQNKQFQLLIYARRVVIEGKVSYCWLCWNISIKTAKTTEIFPYLQV